MVAPLDEAREYLARVLPWPQDESSSFINTHWTFVPQELKPGQKLPWTGRAARNLDEAVKALKWALKSTDARDIYVCQSAQSTAQEVITEKGWKYWKPVRLAENAVALKGLWLDIDVKDETKGYKSITDAITALGNFRTAAGLPKPSMVVGSGGGIHVYWLTNRPMTIEEWYPLAVALVAATVAHGLKCDTGVTTDAARVLRVPGTLNHKTEPAKPVTILARTDFDYTVEKLTAALEPYRVAGALPEHLQGFAPHMPRRAPLKGDDDLSGGIQLGLSQLEIRACLDVIPNTGQDWNFWNNTGMRVWAACDGAEYGLEEWQRWSDKTKTDGKDTCEDRWATLNTSPPTRTGAGALITQARAAAGDTTWMPGRVLGASPTTPSGLSVGKATTTTLTPPASSVVGAGAAGAPASASIPPASTGMPSSPPDPLLPTGYTRNAQGVVYLVDLDDDGNTIKIPISDYPMTDAWISLDPRVLHFKTRIDRGRVAEIDLPLEIVHTNEMRKCLQSQGFMLTAAPKLTTEFFVSWIKKLQESKDAVHSAPFGWCINGKTEGFVYGGLEFSNGTEKPAAGTDPVLARMYRPTGDIQPWLDAVKLVTSAGSPQLEVLVASAFAAPLIKFTGHNGMVLSTWSQESGVGKTTALAIAQGVWGSPHKGVNGLQDTENSVMGKVGKLRHLPLYWDEIKTEEQTKKFVNITFQITSGREKGRMRQDATLKESGDWQTLLVVASNDSLLDYVVQRTSTTTAGLMRLFEFEIPPPTQGRRDIAVAQRLIGKLNNNYGHVGLEYAKFLGNNVAKIDKDIEPFLKALNEKLQVTQDERFWLTFVGTTLLGAKYANDLGFCKFDLPAMKTFLFDAFEKMRSTRKSQTVDMKDAMNVSNILSAFLNSMLNRHTVRTNRIHIQRGKPPAGSIKLLNPAAAERMNGIFVHVGVDDKLVRISSWKLSEWLHEKGISRPIFTKALATEFNCKTVHGRIASGTEYAGATEYLIEIPLAGSPLIDFIGEQ